jgi:prepilin-type N-terminal cleavage/methylation domain-containing protein
MNFKRTKGTEGFTLIEVLVALAVVAVTLSAIGSLVAVTFAAPARSAAASRWSRRLARS